MADKKYDKFQININGQGFIHLNDVDWRQEITHFVIKDDKNREFAFDFSKSRHAIDEAIKHYEKAHPNWRRSNHDPLNEIGQLKGTNKDNPIAERLEKKSANAPSYPQGEEGANIASSVGRKLGFDPQMVAQLAVTKYFVALFVAPILMMHFFTEMKAKGIPIISKLDSGWGATLLKTSAAIFSGFVLAVPGAFVASAVGLAGTSAMLLSASFYSFLGAFFSFNFGMFVSDGMYNRSAKIYQDIFREFGIEVFKEILPPGAAQGADRTTEAQAAMAAQAAAQAGAQQPRPAPAAPTKPQASQ